MTTFVYKGLTRNPEIENTLVGILPNIWRLEQVMDTKFCTNTSYKLLLNAEKCLGYRLYRFWVSKGKPKPTEGGKFSTKFKNFLAGVVWETF